MKGLFYILLGVLGIFSVNGDEDINYIRAPRITHILTQRFPKLDKVPKIDPTKTRYQIAINNLENNEEYGMYKVVEHEEQLAIILYWRIKSDSKLELYEITLFDVEKLVSILMRKYGFTVDNCQRLLVNEGIPIEKALNICTNLEPFAIIECQSLTWLDFSLVIDMQDRMRNRGMYVEKQDLCRLVSAIKPSTIPKPKPKQIFRKCQLIINHELLDTYGITNFDADLLCTLMDYTIQSSCKGLSTEHLSQVLKLGLHLGQFIYPRNFPIFVREICVARKIMKRGPSRELCRNSLIKVLVDKADELGDSLVVKKWPFYTDIWRACSYVYKNNALGTVKITLDNEFSQIAFGSIWNDAKFRGKDEDYVPNVLAKIHGPTIEEPSDEIVQDMLDVSTEHSLDDFDRELYIKTIPREKWKSSKEIDIIQRPKSTQDILWPVREGVAINTVQKMWAQILYGLYRDSGNKAYNIQDFELISSRIDPNDVFETCSRLIYAKIKKYPGFNREGYGERFPEQIITNWCGAIDGNRSVKCTDLLKPAHLWAKDILKYITDLRDESAFTVDIRDVCTIMGKIQPWTYSTKQGLTNYCIETINSYKSLDRTTSNKSFVEKYHLTDIEQKKICMLFKPANQKNCKKLPSKEINLAYKLVNRLAKIRHKNNSMSIPYDVGCQIINKVKFDGTIEHCVIATAEHIGYYIVKDNFSHKKLSNRIKSICEDLFDSHESDVDIDIIDALISEIFNQIKTNVILEPTNYNIFTRKLSESMYERINNSALGIKLSSKISPSQGKMYDTSYFSQKTPNIWSPFHKVIPKEEFYKPDIIKFSGSTDFGRIGVIKTTDRIDYFDIIVTNGPYESWANILESTYDSITLDSPSSFQNLSKPNFKKLSAKISITPNYVFQSCLILLESNGLPSNLNNILCSKIDPYSNPACNTLLSVLLNHAERIQLNSVDVKKFDLADICKTIYVLNPLQYLDGKIGQTAEECSKSALMSNFKQKYSMNNDEMTSLCSDIDFTRTQSFTKLTTNQRIRVILSSISISKSIATKYSNEFKLNKGVFWARVVPRVSFENMINLVSNTGDSHADKTLCDNECSDNSAFFNNVFSDIEACLKACNVDISKHTTPSTYDMYAANLRKNPKKRIWWIQDEDNTD